MIWIWWKERVLSIDVTNEIRNFGQRWFKVQGKIVKKAILRNTIETDKNDYKHNFRKKKVPRNSNNKPISLRHVLNVFLIFFRPPKIIMIFHIIKMWLVIYKFLKKWYSPPPFKQKNVKSLKKKSFLYETNPEKKQSLILLMIKN